MAGAPVSSGRPFRQEGMAGAQGARATVQLVQGEQTLVLGQLGPRERGDLEIVDDLLRLQLVAGRLGWRVRISECRQELRELFDLMGMAGRFECTATAGDDPRRRASAALRCYASR
jgi:hypothetical protein